MVNSPHVAAWLALGALSAALDLVMSYRRYTGKMGQQVQEKYLSLADQVGGLRVAMAFSLFVDFALPPLALAWCGTAYVKDWNTRQDELASTTGES